MSRTYLAYLSDQKSKSCRGNKQVTNDAFTIDKKVAQSANQKSINVSLSRTIGYKPSKGNLKHISRNRKAPKNRQRRQCPPIMISSLTNVKTKSATNVDLVSTVSTSALTDQRQSFHHVLEDAPSEGMPLHKSVSVSSKELIKKFSNYSGAKSDHSTSSDNNLAMEDSCANVKSTMSPQRQLIKSKGFLHFSTDEASECDNKEVEASTEETCPTGLAWLIFHMIFAISSYFISLVIDIANFFFEISGNYWSIAQAYNQYQISTAIKMLAKVLSLALVLALCCFLGYRSVLFFYNVISAQDFFVKKMSLPHKKLLLFQDHSDVNLGDSVQKLELSFREMQFKVADQYASVLESLKSMEKRYQDDHIKVVENQQSMITTAQSIVDKSMQFELLKNNEEFENKIENLRLELNYLHTNNSNIVLMLEKGINTQAEASRHDYELLVARFGELEKQIFVIENKLKSLEKSQQEVIVVVENHFSNSSFIREISNQQFMENFVLLLQKGTNVKLDKEKTIESQRHKYLAYVFLEWLQNQGFVEVKSLHKLNGMISRNISKMERNFKEALENSIRNLKKAPYKAGVSLNTIVPQHHSPSHLSESVIKTWINDALNHYSSDRIALPDFALESGGASIVEARTSPSYCYQTSYFLKIFEYNNNSPNTMLRPGVMPGECWAFKGPQGHAVISLSATIRPCAVSIDHVSKSISLNNGISSAPKDFSVYGLKSGDDINGRLLGMFRYEDSGEPIQQFEIVDVGDSFSFIELRVESNWGHPDFTCIYRFRVHGQRVV